MVRCRPRGPKTKTNALSFGGRFLFLRDRHGTLRRRVFSRHRGLSPWELECLETFEYSAVGGLTAPDETGDDDGSHAEASGGGGGGGCGGEENRDASVRGAGSERVGDEISLDGAEVGSRGDEERSGSGGGEEDCSDCAICLGGFKDADLLRKLPW